MATVRDDDVGGDGRDDDESVSRGGTPVPLSDGSGATPGGGAAGSVASETSERAGASGASDETTGNGDGSAGGNGVGHEAGSRKGRRRATGAKSRIRATRARRHNGPPGRLCRGV